MPSTTKEVIIQRHNNNQLLNTPAPSIMMHTGQDLSADEIWAPLDERIIASTTEALEAGQTHYVNVPGISPLREAIANYLNDTTGTSYQEANVIVTAGVQESRFLTIQMIGEQFDSFGVPAVVHPGVRKVLGVRPISIREIAVDPDNGFLPTTSSIQQALENGCQFLYLESPSRLTGATFSADEVSEVANLIASYNAAVIWDQGLMPFVEDAYPSLSSHASISSKVAVIGEPWPGMGLSSWFLGYIASPEEWIPKMQSQKQIMAICTSTPTQYAALEASKLFTESHAPQLEKLKQTRNALTDLSDGGRLEIIKGDAVNTLALQLPSEMKNEVMEVISEAGYSVADGGHFGASDVVRLSVSPNRTGEVLQHIIAVVREGS